MNEVLGEDIGALFYLIFNWKKKYKFSNHFFRAHFNYNNPEKSEMSFNKSDVFHVVDTLHNGVVGSWQAFRMGMWNHPS